MPVEVAKLVDDFNKLWPRGTDPVSKADDHIRMIKEVLQLEFELLYNKTRVFSFEKGAVVNPNCILYYEAEKAFYQWNGAYDVNNEYVVNAGSTPETAGGIGGNAWTRSTGSGFMSTVLVSDTEPTAPFQNMLWWDTNSGIFFIYYNDGTSTQWVDLFGIADQASFNTLLFRSVFARLAAESGYTLVGGSFQEGAVSSGSSDVVLDWNTAKFYQWHLNENKEVPVGSTPATSGGIGAGAWVDRTDVTLTGGVTQWFDTVADMKAYPIVDGKVYACKRYYAGGSLIPNLIFVGQNGATADTVSVLATAGAPAKLMSGEYFEQYGVKLDGTDQSAKLNAIYASGLRANLSFCSFSGTLGLKDSVVVPYTINTDIHRGIDILPIAGGVFINSYMFLLNCSNGTTWDDDYPNQVSPHFTGGYFDNSVSNISGLKGVLFAGSWTIANQRGRNMAGIAHQTNDYSDHVSVNNIYAVLPQDGWQVDLYGLGDGCDVNQLHCYVGEQPSLPTPRKLLRCRNTIGGQVRNCIGGHIMIDRCSAITIEASHMEIGQIIIQDSNVVIRNSAVWVNNGYAPVRMTNNQPLTSRYTVIFDGFLSMDDSLWSRPSTYFDIDSTSGFNVEIRNSYRVTRSGATDTSYSQLFGLKVAQNGVEVTAFTRYSWLYSDGSVWDTSSGLVKPYRNKITLGGVSFAGLTSLSATSTPKGEYAAGTYYFTVKLVLDNVRAIGRNMAASEKTATVTINQAIYMSLDFGTMHKAGTLYLYRGTSAGVYTHVCRIPVSNCNQLTDHGNDVNGYPWETTGSVLSLQAIDSAYEFTSSSTVEVTTFNVFTPTLGTWQIGDRIKYLTATPSGGTVKTSSRRLTTGSAHVYGTDWYYTTEAVSST